MMFDKIAQFVSGGVDITKVTCNRCGETIPIQYIIEHECIQELTVRELKDGKLDQGESGVELFPDEK